MGSSFTRIHICGYLGYRNNPALSLHRHIKKFLRIELTVIAETVTDVMDYEVMPVLEESFLETFQHGPWRVPQIQEAEVFSNKVGSVQL